MNMYIFALTPALLTDRAFSEMCYSRFVNVKNTGNTRGGCSTGQMFINRDAESSHSARYRQLRLPVPRQLQVTSRIYWSDTYFKTAAILSGKTQLAALLDLQKMWNGFHLDYKIRWKTVLHSNECSKSQKLAGWIRSISVTESNIKEELTEDCAAELDIWRPRTTNICSGRSRALKWTAKSGRGHMSHADQSNPKSERGGKIRARRRTDSRQQRFLAITSTVWVSECENRQTEYVLPMALG